MQLKSQAIKEQARVSYDYSRNRYTVMIGVTMPHSGTLTSCEQWCRERGISIRNQDQVNRIKYGNMPEQESGL
jgi:hypothetical protein